MNRSIGWRSPSPVSYRPIWAILLGTGSDVANSSVRSSHQSSVAQNPCVTTSCGASSHAGNSRTAR